MRARRRIAELEEELGRQLEKNRQQLERLKEESGEK
jgi:hypothetical protein